MMELKTVTRIPKFRGLIAEDDGSIIGFRGRHLMRLHPPFKDAETLGLLPYTFRQSCARFSLLRRLLRQEVFHMVRTPAGSLIGASPQGILRKNVKEAEFRVVFQEFQGKRPMSLCVDGEGRVYFGEYFSNPKRRAVRVFVSEDDGQRWRTCYEFPAGEIRHVHGLFWDSEHRRIWVFTGDDGKEVQIGCAAPRFENYRIVAQQDQLSRACSCVVAGDKLIFATDTPIEKNYACVLDLESGRIDRRAELPHSVFFMAQALGGILLSTVVEPSRVNPTQNVHIWFSSNGVDWREVASFGRDLWHLKLFQYPTVYIAPGSVNSEFAFLSCRAIRGHDGACLVVSRR
jgi:hypothetical protein